MHIYLQWARGVPQDWETIQVDRDRDWFSLPSRPEPEEGTTGTTELDVGGGVGIRTVLDVTHATANDPGWIYELSCGGIRMSGADHYHVDRDGANLRLTRWVDDDEDWPNDHWAQEWNFAVPAFDSSAGKVQPRFTVTAWAQDPARAAEFATRTAGAGEQTSSWTVPNWNAWSPPGPANRVRHGIWQTDANVAAQEAALTFDPGYDQWIAELQ